MTGKGIKGLMLLPLLVPGGSFLFCLARFSASGADPLNGNWGRWLALACLSALCLKIGKLIANSEED